MHLAQHIVGCSYYAAQRFGHRRRRLLAQIGPSLLFVGLVGTSLAGACQSSAQNERIAEPRPVMRQQVCFATVAKSPPFWLEQARSLAEQQKGLMFRRTLAPTGGMMFIFDSDAPRQFWMKNTYIALDMLFVGADLRVVGIVEDAEPQSLEERGVVAACRYVIELAGGTAKRLGIKVGTQVQLGPARREAL